MHVRHDMEPRALGRAEVPRLAASPVRISRADWDELVAHAREDAPNERCGYLRARDGVVEEVFRAVNKRASPYGYEFEFEALRAANELDDEGFEVACSSLASKSPAEPSQTDINLAHYPNWRYSCRSTGSSRCAADRRRQGRGGTPRRRMARRVPCGAAPSGGEAFCPRCGMPLAGEPLDAPLSEAHDRARKIDPRYSEGELVRVAGATRPRPS